MWLLSISSTILRHYETLSKHFIGVMAGEHWYPHQQSGSATNHRLGKAHSVNNLKSNISERNSVQKVFEINIHKTNVQECPRIVASSLKGLCTIHLASLNLNNLLQVNLCSIQEIKWASKIPKWDNEPNDVE